MTDPRMRAASCVMHWQRRIQEFALYIKVMEVSQMHGIQVCCMRGKISYFLDGDDLLPHSAVEKLVSSCEKRIIRACNWTTLRVFRRNAKRYRKNGTVEKVAMEEAMRRMFLFQGIGHSACGKLYRRELWNKLKFPYGRLYEDYATIYRVTSKSKTVSIIEEPVYYYRMRDGSIMHSGIQRKNL